MSEQVAAHGFQVNSGEFNGDYWCAIANASNGKIPGKSWNGRCWYSDGGKVIESTDFRIVDVPVIFTDDINEVKPLGKDETGLLYCAVIDTEWGKIPGKAKRDIAWFTYGEEHRSVYDTSKFKYVGPAIASLGEAEKNQALYDQGKDLEGGFNNDFAAARAKYTEAAEKGFAPALYELGNYAYYGRGGYSGNDADEAEALKFWTQAADQDHIEAACKVGMLYYNGRNWLPQDNAKAKAVLQKGYDSGHSESKGYYEGILQREEYLKHDAEAVQAVIQSADGGDAEARFQAAKYYENGATGLTQDNAKALEYLRLAADEGALASAQVYLGNAYDHANLGLEEDHVTALAWYRRAADQGSEDGLFKIGEFYENGYGGLDANIGMAKEFYAKAGSSGQSAIDRIEEPERNRAEVARLTEAVAAGDAEAQAQLGWLYQHGQKGVAEDKERALELYRLSADQGSALGNYNLGLYYLKVVALKYFDLAAEQGHYSAVNAKCFAQFYF